MTAKQPTDEQLAHEAKLWDSRELSPHDWLDAPEAVPRHKETTQISLRVPKTMLKILREFARRHGIGYQVLMKRWLDDRIRAEADKLRSSRHAASVSLEKLEQNIQHMASQVAQLKKHFFEQADRQQKDAESS